MSLLQSPSLFFLGYVVKLQVNFRKLFRGSNFVFGVGFLGSLAGILALFGTYWLRLTMFQTLGYLAIVGSVNIWFGHMLLKRLASQATESGAKKSKKE